MDRFRAEAGALKARQLLKLTWTKRGSGARQPGVYAVFDFSAQYERVARQCGFVQFRLPGPGSRLGLEDQDEFKVSMMDSIYLSDARAAEIEKAQGRAGLDKVWSEMSAGCANYVATQASDAAAPTAPSGGQ